jgi:hypothetical protein
MMAALLDAGDGLDLDVAAEMVRQPNNLSQAHLPHLKSISPPAHLSKRLLIELNVDWRVVEDSLQYILQHRKGRSRSKATGWVSRSFCRTRAALLRCVHEYCGSVDEKALQQLSVLPARRVEGAEP